MGRGANGCMGLLDVEGALLDVAGRESGLEASLGERGMESEPFWEAS